MCMNLSDDVKFIKGVGPKRASALARLNIRTVEDLITFFPRTYQDRTKVTKISDIVFNNQYCIFGKIKNVFSKNVSKFISLFVVEITDGTGNISAVFYRKVSPYAKFDIFASMRKNFIPEKFVYVYGTLEYKFANRQISVDDYEIVENSSDIPKNFKKIIPIYDLTAGITQKNMLAYTTTVVNAATHLYPDAISNNPKYKTRLMPIRQAIKELHFPTSLENAEQARKSFALQEFLLMQIVLTKARQKNIIKQKTNTYKITREFLTPFKNKLKFEFTKGQKKAINEIFFDMMSSKGMNRMLMGDVGSGKTVVALSAILLAIENGYQAAIIAPTEILAEQHFLTFKNLLDGLNIKIELLTSSNLRTKSKREEILSSVESGAANIVVGTHSVMEERVKFKNLSLVVIDEQHRFGVLQKAALLAKGKVIDILMMTATPIPRGLAMTMYGDISISVIKELPPNRIPIKTFCFSEQQAYTEALEEISRGNQIFIIYPLIDESDKTELKSAVKEAETLAATVFKNNRIALLHGKMAPKEKNEIMQRFKNKEFDILVATTVIEVGIDIPNATMIIIQHADRYGLATLHQLRGRVGRGTKQSYCILVSSAKGQNSAQRLAIMTQTNDGFKIAEEDLKMRGPGDFTGTIQHGFPEFKAGNIVKDVEIIEYTKNVAQDIIKNDPTLSLPENEKIKQLINGKKYSELSKIIQVG